MVPEETVEPPKKHKDFWDKVDIILRPVGGLLTAVTIAIVSYIGSDYLNKSQENEAKTRLYTELMSRREESESALRKDMFTSIINTLLKNSTTLDEQILQLELLAYNFHESLNLMPLFTYLDRRNNEITTNPVKKASYKMRLYNMSKEVTAKQIASLEGVATIEEFNYCYDTTNCGSPIDSTFTCIFIDTYKNGNRVDTIQHLVELTVLGKDPINYTLDMRLKICTQMPDREDKCADPQFLIDYFEFPMIDNTRLINDKRCSVVLRDFDNIHGFVQIDIIFFPGTHSSLKERPYYDDIVAKLLPQN